MVNGFARDTILEKFEDLLSLKKNMKDTNWSGKRFISRKYTQTGTAGAVEVGDPSGETIAQIGKGEVTVLLAGDADNASSNGKTYNFTYLDSLKASHTVVGTGTATLNATPVAFVPAVTDFYEAVSLDGPADANVNVYVATAAIAQIYATLTKGGALEATASQLFGVGSIMIYQKTDQAADYGMLTYGKYRNNIGDKKYFIGTLDGANSTTPEIIYEATYVESTNTYTVTTTTVKDFLRMVELVSANVVTDEVIIADITGSAAVYNVIPAVSSRAVFTRYLAPISTERSFLASLVVGLHTAAITLALTYTRKGDVAATVENLPLPITTFPTELITQPVELEPLSEVFMTIIGNTAVVNVDLGLIEGIKA